MKKNKKNKKRKKSKKKNKIKKTFNTDEYIDWMINKEDGHINQEIFQKYFKIQKPSLMYKVLRTINDKKKNINLVNMFNSALKDLEEDTKNMSKKEKEIEKPDEIVRVVKMILDFNKLKQQKGQGIKILTPNQMLNRLPIALAQLQAGNNSNKLKNEIRQLLYSLYCSKNVTKQIYKSLISII